MKYLNEKGNALVFTIFTLVFVSILGLSLLTVTANSNKTTVNERLDQSIYYIAEAGLNLEKAKLYPAINSATSTTITQFNLSRDKENFNVKTAFDTAFKANFCPDNPDYCNGKEKEHTSFEKQLNKSPISKTVLLKNCTGTTEMNCKFTIKSNGSFLEHPSKTRKLEQTIKISFKINKNSTGATEDGQPPNVETELPFPNVVAITKGNITNKVDPPEIWGNLASLTNDYNVQANNLFNGAKTLNVEKPADIDHYLDRYLPPFLPADFNILDLPKNNSKLSIKDPSFTNKSLSCSKLNVDSSALDKLIAEFDNFKNAFEDENIVVELNSDIKLDVFNKDVFDKLY